MLYIFCGCNTLYALMKVEASQRFMALNEDFEQLELNNQFSFLEKG